MKNMNMIAVAISLLCSSCVIEDETDIQTEDESTVESELGGVTCTGTISGTCTSVAPVASWTISPAIRPVTKATITKTGTNTASWTCISLYPLTRTATAVGVGSASVQCAPLR